MKHLLFLLLPMSAFSQNWPGELPKSKYSLDLKPSIYSIPKRTPDTLRAICLVTLFPNGIAHARMGFVVIAEGKEVVYLDCRKNALKLPQVGWGYKLIDPNYKK